MAGAAKKHRYILGISAHYDDSVVFDLS